MIINKLPEALIKAVVFDLDATLMDTEPNWYLADKKLLSEYNIDLTQDMKKKYIGKSIDDMLDDLILNYGLNEDKNVLFEKKNRYYLEIALQETNVFPQMKNVLEELNTKNIPKAVASGTAYDVIDKIFRKNGLNNEFKFYLSSEQFEKGKPAPDIYLKAAEMLEENPKEILVFEDSIHGVESAKAAGMYCVAIPYVEEIGTPGDEYNIADILFEEGMASFSWKELNSVLNL